MFQQGLLVRSPWQALGMGAGLACGLVQEASQRLASFSLFLSFVLRYCFCWDLQRPLQPER